jgi:hypothetical protein
LCFNHFYKSKKSIHHFKLRVMKSYFVFIAFVATSVLSMKLSAQSSNLYLDVHHIGPGKVTTAAVAAAHQKDLAVEKKHGVTLLNYWVDVKTGTVMCLAEAPNADSLINTHKEANGLIPDQVYHVTAGQAAALKGKNSLYMDMHELGAGKVTAKNVAGAHQKDLAVEKKHDVNLINYWVDEEKGVVMCLAQAPDADSLINTHKEAHGLVPVSVIKVTQGK